MVWWVGERWIYPICPMRWCECCYFKRRVTVVVVAAAISCDYDDTALFRQALDSLTHTHTNTTRARWTNFVKYALARIGALVSRQSRRKYMKMQNGPKTTPKKEKAGGQRSSCARPSPGSSRFWLWQKRQSISHYHQSLCATPSPTLTTRSQD